MKKIAIALILLFVWSDAHAWWWLLRGLATRGAARAAVRSAATTGAVASGESVAGFAYTRPLAGVARFCVRPVGATACDMHNGATPAAAAQRAIGKNYRLKPTGRPGVFEVIDTAGNFVSAIEALDRQSNRDVARLPQYVPPTESTPVFIHNSSEERLYMNIRGEKCSFDRLVIEPFTRSDIYCPNSREYYVEMTALAEHPGERYQLHQKIDAAGHYRMARAASAPYGWKLLRFYPEGSDEMTNRPEWPPDGDIEPGRVERAGSMEVILESANFLESGKVEFSLVFRNSRPGQVNVMAALKAMHSDGIADFWKAFPMATSRVITSQGGEFACRKASGIGYARGNSDWLALEGANSRRVSLTCDGPSASEDARLDLILDLWVAEGDGGYVNSAEYSLRFSGVAIR